MDLTAFQKVFDFFGISMTDTIAFGGTVSLFVSFLKTFLPQLQGKVTRIVAGAISIALSVKAYWGVPPAGPDIVAIIASSFFVWAIALGAFGLIKKAGGFPAPTLPGARVNGGAK